jgi:hypothetical protein
MNNYFAASGSRDTSVDSTPLRPTLYSSKFKKVSHLKMLFYINILPLGPR